MQQTHRPGPLHQTNKPHKGGRHQRKLSAASELKNKVVSKPANNLRRDTRLNQSLQARKLRREQAVTEKRKLGSETSAPILIGLLGNTVESCSSFLEKLKNFDDHEALTLRSISPREHYVLSSRLKMRFKLILLDPTNFDDCLANVKVLDLLMMLHKPHGGAGDEADEDALAELHRIIHIHCLPTYIHVIDGTTNPLGKDLNKVKKALKSQVNPEDKLHIIDKDQSYLQLFHTAGNCKRQRSLFRESRPIVATDHAEIVAGNLAFLGFVRKKTLSANDLIHILGFDDYQIQKIDILPDVVPLRPQSLTGDQVVDTLIPDQMKQETLDQENELDPMEGEQTWPTAEELAAEAERRNTKKIIKKLPPGTSEYQGAWIGESDEEQSDCDSDDEDYEDGDDMAIEVENEEEGGEIGEGGSEDESGANENEPAEDTTSMMDVDEYDKKHSNEKEMKILEKLREARQEEMFPDEVDTPFDVPARYRFARFRGLKSFRTSHWDPQENLPPDYSKIYQFQNFQQTKRRLIRGESDTGANPGQYVRIHLSNVPETVINSILSKPITPNLVGLLKYERKMTVMNLLIKRVQHGNLRHPIKSKDELVFYVGYRRFKAQPLFSNNSIASKFKYERFLRDDVAMVATIYAPITFSPAPVLVFREKPSGARELVASGSVMDSNPNRLIIKRIRLSGHPHKIHSKSAVLRFMFFNHEDVLYFKPVELVTKYNRRGHITEPLGTHGHMKCTFDKKIRSDDCVFMNLYKRVFPKWTYKPIFDLHCH